MASKIFDEEYSKKSRTITLEEFVEAESKVLAEFAQATAAEPEGAMAMLPVMMTMPVIMGKLAHTLFDEAEPAMDEAQDADRVS